MSSIRIAVFSLATLALAGLAAPLLVGLLGLPGPGEVDTSGLSPVFGTPTGPSASHLLGVDWLGRDVLSRTLYGTRVSLFIGVVAAGGAVAVGVALGVVAAYRGGVVDLVVSRLTETFLVIPYLLLALGIGATCSTEQGCAAGAIRPGVPLVVLVIVLTSWPVLARIVRNETLALQEREFVAAARVHGAGDLNLIGRELLPNLLPAIRVMAIVLLPQVVVAEAALSYLGVGVPASTPSWGGMIASAAPSFPAAWWLMVFPGAMLVTTVLACSVIADRQRENARSRGGR